MSGIPAWAVPGVKVVCVDASWRGPHSNPLVKGAIYTIVSVDIGSGYRADGTRSTEAVLDLSEVSNPYDCAWQPDGFGSYRFRPLVSDSDELGIETVLYRAKGRKSKASARESERA